MKTISSRSQYLDDQIACIVDSLIFGHLQRKQYSKTLHALLSESPHLTKDATTVQNAPNQIILNVNCFLHDRNLEQIIETFYTYGRFDVSPNLLDLGKRLRDLSNEFASELAFGCHSYGNNEQRLYGRKVRTRSQQNPIMFVEQIPFDNRLETTKRPEYDNEQVGQSTNGTIHNSTRDIAHSQSIEFEETRAGDLSVHEFAHHRRKSAQPMKQSQRVMQIVESQLVKMSNENLRDKDAGVDISSIDPFLEVNNFNEILKNVVDDETLLYDTLDAVEREEAMEADHNSCDSINMSGGATSLALDIPMHEDSIPSTSFVSPITRQPSTFPSHNNSFSIPIRPHSSQNAPISMSRSLPRPLMDPYIEHPSITNNIESTQGSSNVAYMARPPPPSNPPVLSQQSKSVVIESEKKHTKDMRENSSTRNGGSPSQLKSRMPPPSTHSLPPSTSSTIRISPKLSNVGRIPKKGQSSTPIVPSALTAIPSSPSPSASPRTEKSTGLSETVRGPEGFCISKGKVLPLRNGVDVGRESLDSQDTLHAELVGESDCTMTENEDNDYIVKKEGNKLEKKNNWDALFDDTPLTVEESNREKERQRELQENKRRLEMREMEKKREREKRRKDKEKKDDDKREKREDRSRYEKKAVEERRRESMSKDDREEKEKEDRQRKRREQEEQKKIIEAQKRQMEIEEKARQKKKEEEDRKKELKDKEDEKRREKDKEIKKIEEEKMRREKEIKLKEEKRNELERRRRREAQLKKSMERTPLPLGDSPLDKIAAEMDGKELRKENEIETTPRTNCRVMEISSGLERHRPTTIYGSLHSSKTGIFLDKAQKLRDSTERQQSSAQMRRPIRPNRVQMAPMKRPPAAMVDNDEDEDEEEEERDTPSNKRGRLEDNAIDNILNKLYR